MKIAVEGCAHGELDNIYATIQRLEAQQDFKIDLLICCGDFQASRNLEDLRCMAVPPKYYNICSFYKYYTGEKVAPVLTIFIGGNHEASNHLQELPYGGWVAPRIYYMGYAGVVNIAGVRIGGLSGIYKGNDYLKGHFEHPPYSDSTKRSVYHIRNLEVFRLKQISEPLDIFLSHDWPSGVWEHGNKKQLIRFKPFFEQDMESGELGSKPCGELLNVLKPDYWFAAHLHCKFAAVVPHACGKITKFLALDKCLPKRRFLQIFDIPHDEKLKTEISYDLEWLTILRMTNHLLSVKHVYNYLPGPTSNEKWCFTPADEDRSGTSQVFGEDLQVPQNFVRTAEGYRGPNRSKKHQQPRAVSNPQTVSFCSKLLIDDPLSLILTLDVSASATLEAPAEASLDRPTFVESETSTNVSVPKKLAMTLPEPVNAAEDQTAEREEEEEAIRTVEKEGEGEGEGEEARMDKNEDAAAQSVVEEGASTNSQSNSESNQGRAFKRRNASIYQNDD